MVQLRRLIYFVVIPPELAIQLNEINCPIITPKAIVKMIKQGWRCILATHNFNVIFSEGLCNENEDVNKKNIEISCAFKICFYNYSNGY